MTNKEYFKKNRFGMMAHFGLYSLLGGEWQGKRTPLVAEWAQSYFRIKKEEYEKLAKVFNPIFFHADEFVDLAIEAGMKYIVFTAKHHDGFALFHSKADKFNSFDSSPCKRDLIDELANACEKKGMKLGLYYSQALDWHEEHGGGYDAPTKRDGMSWSNDWDFPDKNLKNYSICFEEKIYPQVTELLKNYGDLFLIWFDTPYTINAAQSKLLYDLIKKYQSDCLINSRIGNGVCDYTSLNDNEIPQEQADRGMMFETPATINDTWGFKIYDQNWKSAEELKRIKEHLSMRGINYLLNVGPDALGRIPAPSIEILKKISKS